MRQWLVVVPPDRYGAERLYHHDTLELSGGDQAELALGDRVVLAAGDPLVVFGLGRVTGTVAGDESDPDDPDAPEPGEGERGISYTHRLLDEPVPWGGAVARPGKPLPLTEAEFGALLARVSPDRAVTAPRRSWLVGVELPIEAAIANARAALDLPDGLAKLLWSYAPEPRPRPAGLADVPASTPESKAMSKDLKRRGFRFVGPTTAYALMQATGMVDDHLAGCWVPPAR